MTEIEREAVLYERAQARLAKAERRELERKMQALERGEARPVRGPSASIERKRRSLSELKARREKKRRGEIDSDSEYNESDGHDEEEEDGEVRARGRRGTSRRSDSEYEEEAYEPLSKGRGEGRTDKKLTSVSLIDLELANCLRLPRDVVAKWIFHPDFDETARGCLLRLSVSKGHEQVYRLVEIKKIVKYHRAYRINEVTTNKAAVLKYGKSEKTFRLDVISNSEFTAAEFDRWMATMREEHQPMITRRVAESRAAAWKLLEESPVSDTIVSAMVAAKRELGSAPRNLVSERTMLQHLRDEAISNNNRDEVERIDDELAQLASEQAAQQPRKAGDARLDALAEINKRNRRMNMNVGGQQTAADPKKASKTEVDTRLDPFSRRKCQPTNFNAFFEEPREEDKQVTNSEAVSARTTDAKESDFATTNDTKSSPAPPQADAVPEEKAGDDAIDLFAAARSVDIEIDI